MIQLVPYEEKALTEYPLYEQSDIKYIKRNWRVDGTFEKTIRNKNEKRDCLV